MDAVVGDPVDVEPGPEVGSPVLLVVAVAEVAEVADSPDPELSELWLVDEATLAESLLYSS